MVKAGMPQVWEHDARIHYKTDGIVRGYTMVAKHLLCRKFEMKRTLTLPNKEVKVAT